MRVLVVDDEPSVREVLALFLEELQFDVECAGSASDALRLFPGKHWDLVVTDRKMPKMTGDELAAWIRGMDPEVPIMIISGNRDASGSFPFDGALPKPFTRASLQQAVEAVMERRRTACP